MGFPATGAFDDAEVIHVEGDVDPCRDMAIIQNELRLKDAEWIEKNLTCAPAAESFLWNSRKQRF